MRRIAFIDTETTGLYDRFSRSDLGSMPHVIELAYITAELQANGKFTLDREVNTFIKPPIAIPADASNVNGITDDMVKDAPRFFDIAVQTLADLGCSMVVAHNAAFDVDVLTAEFERLGISEFKTLIFCTVHALQPMFGGRVRLGTAYKHSSEKPPAKAHRALDDVKTMIEIVRHKNLLLNMAQFLHSIPE